MEAWGTSNFKKDKQATTPPQRDPLWLAALLRGAELMMHVPGKH